MKVIISRTYTATETLGSLFIMDGYNKIFECKTIELPIITIPLKLNSIKTNCIPEGEYEVIKTFSPTKGRCFHILNIPNRTNILIHVGNYATGKQVDTEGCILPGSKFKDINGDGNLDVIESANTMKALLGILPNKFKLYIL